MSKDKKKFKDTGLFNAIKKFAPEVIDKVTDVAADIYPPLGIVNNLVDKAIGVAKEKGDKDAEAILNIHKEDYLRELDMQLKDVQDARTMYETTGHKKADDIASKVINFNLWIILFLVVAMALVIMYVEGQIAAVISGIVGTAIGNLFQERNTVIGFFFGSSQGSKDKDNK